MVRLEIGTKSNETKPKEVFLTMSINPAIPVGICLFSCALVFIQPTFFQESIQEKDLDSKLSKAFSRISNCVGCSLAFTMQELVKKSIVTIETIGKMDDNNRIKFKDPL